MQTKAKPEIRGFVYFAVGVAALGGLLFGYDSERRDSDELGNEPGGSGDIPDPGRSPGAGWNFLVIRCNRCRRLDLCVSAGA